MFTDTSNIVSTISSLHLQTVVGERERTQIVEEAKPQRRNSTPAHTKDEAGMHTTLVLEGFFPVILTLLL